MRTSRGSIRSPTEVATLTPSARLVRACQVRLGHTRLKPVKRTQVIRIVRQAANRADLNFRVVELKRHTGIVVGDRRSTLGRHSEVDVITVKKFFKQYEGVLGEGWWK